MMRINRILYLGFLLANVLSPASGEIKFKNPALSGESTLSSTLLFTAQASLPGSGAYDTLFLADVKAKTNAQFTHFPEEIIFLSGLNALQIQNRFGVFRSGPELKDFSALPNFPTFVNGHEIEQGKITPMKTSPDGRYLVFYKATSGIFGTLLLLDVAAGKETVLSEKAALSLKGPPVAWSRDSRHLVYEKGNRLFYYSIDHLEKNRVPAEQYRLLAESRLASVQWDAFGNLYYLTGALLYKIGSPTLFTRGLYAGAVQIGDVAGRLAFEFDPTVDRYWISPDGLKIILNKARQNLFFLRLVHQGDAAADGAVSLPHLSLPRSMSVAKVIWSSADQIALLTAGGEDRGGSVFRLDATRAGGTFARTEDRNVLDLALAADERRVLLVAAERIEVRDFATWNKETDVAFVSPRSALWKSNTEVVLAGKNTIELYDTEKKTFTLLTLAGCEAAGFSRDGKSLLARSGGKIYKTSLERPAWQATETYDAAEASSTAAASSAYRAYVEDLEAGNYRNMIMVRDLAGLSTAPLFPYKTYAYEQYPDAEEKTDPVFFDHGSRVRRREVSLVFNAVYSDAGLPVVLAALKDFGYRATFFLNGEFIRRFPDACREIAAAGHEVGSLFSAFFDMTDASFSVDTDYIKKGLARNEDEYFKATGRELALLWHAPYYFTSSSIIEGSKQMNYAYVGRDVDAWDWIGRSTTGLGAYLSAPELAQRVLALKKPGSIIPLELGATADKRDDYLYEYLDELLNALTRLGYQVVPISELIEHAR